MEWFVGVISDPRTGVATVLAIGCGCLVKLYLMERAERIRVQARCDGLTDLFGERNVKALVDTAQALQNVATNQKSTNDSQLEVFKLLSRRQR